MQRIHLFTIAMNSSIPTAMSATDAPMVSSNGTKSMLEKFKKMPAKDQAEFMKDISTVHVKAVKVEVKGKTRKTRDPDAPKREQSEGVKAWHDDIRKTMEASGQVLDEHGKPLMKLDPKTNEMKPVYNLTWREAMSEASARKKAATTGGGAGGPSGASKIAAKPAAAKKAAPAAASSVTTSSSSVAKLRAAAKSRAAPPPPPTIDEDDDDDGYESYEESLTPWTYKNVEYLAGSKGERYKMNPDGSRGDWVGYWNDKTRKMEPGSDPNA